MSLEELATTRYQFQRSLSRQAVNDTLEIWDDMDGSDIQGSWLDGGVADRVFVATSVAQQVGAEAGAEYVPLALEEQGVDSEDEWLINADAFSGVASDGRDLEGLLLAPVVSTLYDIRQGLDPDDALARGATVLERIVDTQVADAGRAATLTGMASDRRVMGYTRMINPPACSRCIQLAGATYLWNDGFDRHPLCLLPGTVVAGPPVLAASRRPYQGEVTVIRTASGQELAVTGNHPVLTGRGWLPARMVQDGDDVVRHLGPDGAHAVQVPHAQQMPSRVEDLWRAGDMSSLRRVPVAAQDFHGDGPGGEVDVVLAHRRLDAYGYSPLLQEPGQESFTVGSEAAFPFAYAGSDDQLLQGHGLSRAREMRRTDLVRAFGGGHPLGAYALSLTHAAEHDPGALQAATDHATADAETARYRLFALAEIVGADDRRNVQRVLTARWDAPAGPYTMQSAAGYAGRGHDLLLRLTPQVERDRVIEIRRVHYTGHVYNLTSTEGWFTADNVVVSNCQCTHIPYAEQEGILDDVRIDPKGYFDSLTREQQDKIFTKAGAEAIRLGADLNQVVNARRGASGLSRAGRLTEAEQTMLRGGRSRGRLERVDVYGRQLAITTEGVTIRGEAGEKLADRAGTTRGRRYRKARTPRLMPDAILELADGDRDEAVRMLRDFGYIRAR